MKTKSILISSIIATSGLLASCDLADSSDHVNEFSNVEHIQSVIRNEDGKDNNIIEVIHNEYDNEDDNDIEVIHNEENDIIGEIAID